MNVTATGPGATARVPVSDRQQAASADGKALPVPGKDAPERTPVSNAASIEKAVEQINAYLRDSRREIEFQVDESSGRTIMRIIDATGEVVRQIPSEEVLKIAAALDARGFHGFSDFA